MANKLLEQLLELPIPEDQTTESLKLLSDQLNLYEVGSKQFIDLKEKLIELGIPKDTPDKYFGIVVTHWYEELIRTTKEAERPKTQDKTSLDKDESIKLQEEEQRRTEQINKARENAKEEVNRMKQRLEEIQIEKDKKLHAKVTPREEINLNEKEKEAYETYKEYTKTAPSQKVVEDLSQEIKKRVGENLKSEGLSEEEIGEVTKETATEIVENLKQVDNPNYVPTTYQTAVLAYINKNPEVVKKVLGNEAAQNLLQESSNNVATTHLLQYQMYKDITRSAFGENFSNKIFGIDADKVDVSFSDTPQAGGITITPYEVVRSNQLILEDRSQTLETIKELGADQAKGFLLKRAGGVLERRIALLTPQSAAGKLLQSVEAKSLFFSTFGVGTPIKWEATNLIGRLALKVAPDYAIPVISGIGKATGINFGVTGTVSTGIKAGTQIAGKVAVQTGAKVGFGALLAKGAAAIGVGLGAFTFGVSTAITIALTAIGKMINWPKVGRWLKENGWILGLGAVAINPWVGIGLAAGIYGLTRQIRLATIGASIWGFFAWIGANIAIRIATPIIITLLIIPPLVAFIMLVINNSAYMVPPAPIGQPGGPPGGGGGSCVLSKEKSSTGLRQLTDNPIQSRAWEIVEDLYEGFWCYYNRPPSNNPPPDGPTNPDFPDDKVLFMPSYPDLFDYEKFKSDPYPERASGINMFWCTWLVQKAYTENGVNILFTLWSPTMENDFFANQLYYNADTVTVNDFGPGAVIFFDVLENEEYRTDHVAVVYSVTGDSIIYLQSNSGQKTGNLSFKDDGVGIIDPEGLNVKSIGMPKIMP